MTSNIIGKGWSFPVTINAQGGLSLVDRGTELDQSIRIILSTAPGQRLMRPSFGCRLHELVFMPNDVQTAAKARRFVEEALGWWEPRIQVQSVEVKPHSELENALLIDIEYEIRTTRDRRTLVYPFYLIPGE